MVYAFHIFIKHLGMMLLMCMFCVKCKNTIPLWIYHKMLLWKHNHGGVQSDNLQIKFNSKPPCCQCPHAASKPQWRPLSCGDTNNLVIHSTHLYFTVDTDKTKQSLIGRLGCIFLLFELFDWLYCFYLMSYD